MSNSPFRSERALLPIILLVALLGLFVPTRDALASPVRSVPTTSVLVPANGSASIELSGLVLQPGAALPSGALSLAPSPLAPERVRTALFYAVDWGYIASQPHQAALAIWHAQDNTWRDSSHATAERIESAAASLQGTPSWNPAGRSILQLLGQGQVTLSSIVLTPVGSELGSAVLRVTNSTSQDLHVYVPYGVIFSGNDGSVIVWATGQAIQTGTEPPAQESTATETSVPPKPTPPDYKGGATPSTENTATPSYKSTRNTPTPESSSSEEPPFTPVPPSETSSLEPVTSALPGTEALPDKQPPVEQATPLSIVVKKPVAPVLPPAQKEEVSSEAPNGTLPKQDTPQEKQQSPVDRQQDNQPAAQPDAPTAEPTKSPKLIPAPVGTETSKGQAQGDDIPVPVQTGEAQPPLPVPKAQETAASAIKTSVTAPTAPAPFRSKETSTPIAPVDSGGGASDTGTLSGSAPGSAKAPAPQPAPVPPQGATDSPATINATTGTQAADPAPAPKPAEAPLAVSAAPSSAPNTGAGPSALPWWALTLSLLFLSVGFVLRRSGTAHAVTINESAG